MNLPSQLLERAAAAPSAVAMRRKRLGRWEELRWSECAERAAAIGTALADAGIAAGDRVVLVARNSPEWILSDLAIQGVGAVTVPVAAVATEEQLASVIRTAGAVAVVAGDEEQVDKVLAVKPRPRALRHVFVVEPRGVDLGASGVEPLDVAVDTASTSRWRGLVRDLDPDAPAATTYPHADDGAAPVVRTHTELAATGDDAVAAGLRPDDEVLSHLPLSLPAEHAVSVAGWLRSGCTVNLASGDDDVTQELREVQPTLVLGVAALWDLVRTGVERRVAGATPLKRAMYRAATGGRLPRPLAHALVCRSVRDKLGLRRARVVLTTGGAPEEATARFFRSIGVNLVEVELP